MMQESSIANDQKLNRKPNASGGLFQFKQFDIYTKIDEDYKVQTSGGALVSIIGWIIIGILVLGEVRNYMTLETKEHMVVDTTLGQHLRINVNITFHALSCDEAHLDAMDVAGDNQLNIEHSMFKQRISADGRWIGEPTHSVVGEQAKLKSQLAPDYCGSCYGAESATRKCCNTCDELKAAYESMGWGLFSLATSEQCLRDMNNAVAIHAEHGEGCQVSGTMRVNKVAGNFHIAHGESIVRDGRHIHQFNPAEAPSYNCSHTVNNLSFGDPYPSMPKNPLDAVTKIVLPEVGTGLYQYFVKIIPTIYSDEVGNQLYTNQFTVTERFRPFALPTGEGGAFVPNQNTVLPGIFFVYELSPFMVEVQRSRTPLAHLFNKLCAIVGGVFTLLGVFDAILFRLQKLLSNKAK